MFGADLGAVIGGLINGGQSLPTIDVSNLLNAINLNKQGNTQLINQLPTNMQALYKQYMDSLGGAGTNLQNTVKGVGQNLLTSTQNLYDPNSPAVQATLAALKMQDYSTLPQTINALKANLAGSGGLNRGAAARGITAATLAPAAQYGQQAATVTGQQLTSQQNATQQALNKIASMDDATAQSIFGMTKEQATQILTSGRQDLQQQLAQLINTNNSATNATMGVLGVSDQNAYNNAVTRNAQQAGVVNGLVNLGVDAATGLPLSSMFGGGGGLDFSQLSQQGLASTPPPGANYAPPGY